MDLDKYQQKAMTTAKYIEEANDIVEAHKAMILVGSGSADLRMILRLNYAALGLAGEAGEFANKVKKIIRDHSGYLPDDFAEELAKELGGVFWYLAASAKEIGFRLEEIAELNLDQLADRSDRGIISGSGDDR